MCEVRELTRPIEWAYTGEERVEAAWRLSMEVWRWRREESARFTPLAEDTECAGDDEGSMV